MGHLKGRTQELGLSDRIHISLGELDQPWPYEDEAFDIAIDNFTSIDIETYEGRLIYREEMRRTLRSGGYALIAVVSAKDSLEQELMRLQPGPEPNSSIWPTGKFQKDYDEIELREFYKSFEILELREIQKPVCKLGRSYRGTNYWLVLRKSV